MNVRTSGASFWGAFLFLFTLPGQTQQARQVLHHHVPPAVSSGQAALTGSLPSEQPLNLSIVLPLRNQSELTSLLSRLYDPSSPDYHHFLTVDQFTEQFGPTAENYQAVVDFVQANGFIVTGKPSNRMTVPITGSVAQIEQAFNVRMNSYRHPTEDRNFYAPDREPSFALSAQMAHIEGLNNYSVPRSMATKALAAQAAPAAAGSGPGGAYLASDMRAAYYTSTVPAGGAILTGSGQTVGLVEFDGYNISDVTGAFHGTATSSANGSNYVLFYTPVAGGATYGIPVNNVLLDGTTGAPVSGSDSEETLDIVQAIGMAPGLSQVRVYIGNDDADILNAMATENLARQLSISWSWWPDDPATDDVFFEEFAAQGQSVFAASGDYGAFDAQIFQGFYPAEDAYVTAVGGTHLNTNGAGGSWSSETAWNSNRYGSGGGISPDGIPIPNWQTGVANSSNRGSTTLRNVPDVAAEADFDNYDCNIGVCQSGWAGTSFAAPRWAGIMALVNQQAVEAGTAPLGGLGFVSPAIYSIGEGSGFNSDLHDTTSGNNDTESQPVWYSAVTGYDLVTGWGSPNGQNLINALAGPQVPGIWLAALPSTLSINQGASATTTIMVTDAGGFTGNVNLAVTSGLPSGVTASWSADPASGSSVLTLTASSSATPGTATLTITGTAGALTASTRITLTVYAPSFTLSALPASLNIGPGSSGTSTITVTPAHGFTGSVNLAVTSGLPKGVTASWSADPVTGSSVLKLIASSSATAGIVTLTITGTSGALTATTTVALTVRGASGTTTTMAVTSSGTPVTSVNAGSVITLTAAVNSGSVPVTTGQVNFCDATVTYCTDIHLLGTAQLTASGTAVLKVIPGIGIHSYKAVFVGANSYATSYSAGSALTVSAAYSSATAIAQSGIPGNYTLTATVTAQGTVSPTGNVSFLDTSNANSVLGTATLGEVGAALIWQKYPQSLATGNVPSSIAAGDFNGDGIPDLAITNQGSYTATILLGNGDGTFTPAASPATGTTPAAVAVADFNGDGNADLATVNLESNTLTILLGNGNGTFTSGASPRTGSTPNSVAVGDFNGDGIPDLAVTNGLGNSVTILLGAGNGTFTAAASPATGSSPESVAVGDFNGDGIPDLAVANGASNTMTILLGNGDGTFTPAPGPPTGAFPVFVAAADFNGDGIPDLAVSNLSSATVTILLGNGDGTFTPAPSLATGSNPANIKIGDFNGDGKVDLAVANTANNTVGVFLGNGDGTFTAAASQATGAYPWALAVGDFNRNGISGLAVANQNSDTVTVLTSQLTQTATATASGISPIGAGTHQVEASYAGDGNYSPSVSATTGLIVPTPTTTALSITPSNGTLTAGASYTLTATVSPSSGSATPTGNVVFTIGTATQTVALNAAGVAAYSGTAPAGAGTLTLSAAYQGTTAFSASTSNTLNETVVVPTTTVLSITPGGGTLATGSSYTLTATVSPSSGSAAPTGNVIFTIGTATQTAALNAAGVATYTGTAPAAAGTLKLSAAYQGTTAFLASTSSTLSEAVAVPTAATVSISPGSGTYYATQTATISDSTPGAVIHYTTNGTNPTSSSAAYSGALAINQTTTLKAIAVASGYNNSAVASVTCTLKANAPTFGLASGTYSTPQAVSISDTTSNAAIWYTTDGTTPVPGQGTAVQLASGTPVQINQTAVLKAVAAVTGWTASNAVSATYTLKANAPTFGLVTGTYSTPQTVSVSDTTPNAAIWYTTDGTTPVPGQGTAVQLASGAPVQINQTTALKAVAAVTGWTTSNAVSATYTLKANAPTFGLASGNYSTPQTVSISDTTPNAAIWYTTDGSAPVPGQGTAVQLASGTPVQINQTTALKAVAAITGWTASNATSATYTLTVTAPTFSLVSGTYSTPQTVSISDTTSNAAIWYTTDGSTPVPGQGTAVHFVSGTPVQINQTTALKAVAALTGWTTSNAASVTYTLRVNSPTFSLASGTYSRAQTISISDTTPNAAIWYTTDGSTPVPGQGTAVQYVSGTPVQINQTTVLKAIAALTGWTTSNSVSDTYTLTVTSPTFSPVSGTYSRPQTVSISDTTPNAAIWYTTDGTSPVPGQGTAVQFITGTPIQINQTTVLKAVAAITGWTSSGIVTATYTIN
jgi:subtilase family serine protease